MALYGKITPSLVDTGIRKNNVVPIPPGQLAPGKDYWVPVVEIENDNSTGNDKVIEGPVKTVYVNRIEFVTTIRDKTPAELDAEDDVLATSLMNAHGGFRALARACFNQENRIRALEGAQPVTAEQFRQWLKGQIRS